MPITRTELLAVIPRFVGDIEQVPPMVSALKVGGRKLYELARNGETIERDARPVHIESITVLDFVDGPYPVATLEVTCGSGTYIRSLAADLGAALGGPAHLRSLRRLRVGAFGVDDAVAIEVIEGDPARALHAPADALRHLPQIEVDADIARGVGHGLAFPVAAFAGLPDADAVHADAAPAAAPLALVDDAGRLLAVYERNGASLRPAVVLAPSGGGA